MREVSLRVEVVLLSLNIGKGTMLLTKGSTRREFLIPNVILHVLFVVETTRVNV